MLINYLLAVLLFNLSYSKISLSSPHNIDNAILLHSDTNSTFYLLGTKRFSKPVSQQNLIKYLLEIDKIEFKIGKKEFTIRPMECIKIITEHKTDKKTRTLGIFKRITTLKNQVVLIFSGNSQSVSGKKYDCVVRFIVGDLNENGGKDSYEYEHGKNSYNITITLRNFPENFITTDEDLEIGIIAKRPTIGSKLANAKKEKEPSKERSKALLEVKNRLFDNAFTITSEKLKKMAEMYSEQLGEDGNHLPGFCIDGNNTIRKLRFEMKKDKNQNQESDSDEDENKQAL